MKRAVTFGILAAVVGVAALQAAPAIRNAVTANRVAPATTPAAAVVAASAAR